MKWQSDQKPLIVGAGIAGLSSALALAHKGISSTIFESREKLEEVGAGIQLASNATRILDRWGILDKIIEKGVEPRFLELKDGLSLKTHIQVDLIDVAKRRWKSPYVTIHRADLQDILYEAASENSLIQMNMGERVVTAAATSAKAIDVETMRDDQRQFYSAPLLVACDGVWSKIRQLPPLNEHAVFSGFIAWRVTIPVDKLPEGFRQALPDLKTIAAWMGPRNHLVAYPVQAGKSFNFVAITQGNNPGETWSRHGEKDQLLNHFKDWNRHIREIFEIVDDWTYWPLYQMPNHRFTGHCWQVFVGDASHGFLPFAAQGSAMAIEDAAALAEVLAMDDVVLPEALSLYSNIRTARVAAVNKRGDFNRFVYHATGPVAFARNLAMKMRSAESFMASLDWLYTYDAMAFARRQ